ncbi:uncharacterized protein BP01DRAFT_326013 [Aspergillus saccharolyticus JOP 1030-1]|uniref:Uncharacterized protein n=1 Tax=Aspergillus saccharolyticus JOP 1030-1 TaxID=1450539 RepID=A0A319A3P1_9EURO|nr:hypothetical protein BP01DRAFT_326013 [Aspergillus saccharolyticus JOP 1030-1]PYH42072.1 hypothetical protein BP01DRAFT_326013 [Aspergillus saccharolyticus JOP 1030-1]
MAAPTEVTIKNLSGEWTMNKTLSNSTDPILSLQGMSWLTRKALNIATVTLHINAYPDSEDASVIHIHIDQTLTGGVKGTSEHRLSDGKKREHTDHLFGHVEGQSRYIRGSTGSDGRVRPNQAFLTKSNDPKVVQFLNGEILADGKHSDGFLVETSLGQEFGEGEGLWFQSFVESLDNGWTAEQIWGFEVIDGERYYTRRVVVAKGKQVELARFVYSYVGPRKE